MSKCVCGLYDDQPCSREVCRRGPLITLPTDGPKPVTFDWGGYAGDYDPNREARRITLIDRLPLELRTEAELITRPSRDAERFAKQYAADPYAYRTVEQLLGH